MKNWYHSFALALLLATTSGLFSAASGQNLCTILYTQPDTFLPLIYSHVRGILYPVYNWSIEVLLGETIDIVCTGFNNYLVGTLVSHMNATCEQPESLNIESNIVFKCTKRLAETVAGLANVCGSRGTSSIFYIGWPLPNNEFLWQIEVCFNTLSFSTEYTKHVLLGSMFRGSNVLWTRPDFRPEHLYDMAYKNQSATVANLLQNSTIADAYINGWGPDSYLARGHLAPAGDYNTQSWKDSTFYYINAVPQWQAHKNGNWKTLEDSLKSTASEGVPRSFIIYTGTHGVLKLPDVNNNSVSIFLLNGTHQRGLPVPENIWKVVYDEQRNEAIAFVLLNHPNNPQYPIEEPIPLCPDICDRIMWNPWRDRHDKNKGKIYCCTVQALRSKIPSIPVPDNARLMFDLWKGFGDGYQLVPKHLCSNPFLPNSES